MSEPFDPRWSNQVTIETTGEFVSEETIAPNVRQRSNDPHHADLARMKFRENYDLAFGPRRLGAAPARLLSDGR